MRAPLVLLAAAALVLAGADSAAPAGLPSIDQIANATPATLLALGFLGMLRGWIVPGYLNERTEARATAALAAAQVANATAASAVAAVAALTAEHKEERTQQEAEMGGLQRELARLTPADRA